MQNDQFVLPLKDALFLVGQIAIFAGKLLTLVGIVAVAVCFAIGQIPGHIPPFG